MAEPIGVKLSKRMPKGEQAYGLDSLGPLMAKGIDTQYVLLAIQPVEDIRPRVEGGRLVGAVITAVEGLATADHRRAAERMLREARLARRGHEDRELPIPD
jgi:hypothetical protein